MFQKIMEYAGPYKKRTIQASLVIFLSVLVSVLPFVSAYQIIVPLVSGREMDVCYILIRVGMVFICLVLHACLYVKGLEISHEAAYNTLMRIRVSLQKRMENLPLGVIQEKGTGSIKRLFVDDVESMEMILAHTLPEGFGNVMIPVIVYIAMFCVDWKLAFLSMASLPLGLLSMMLMWRIGMKGVNAYYEGGRVMNNTIIEYVNGMEVVKVFNKDRDSYKRFRADILAYRDLTLDWYKACWPWMALYNSVLPCTLILTLPIGSWMVLRGYSSLQDLILVMCLSLSIGIPLLKAISFMPSMPQINYKLAALEQMLEAPPLKQGTQKFSGKDHTVSFEDVSFAYGEKAAVWNVNLTIKEGKKTALVGESGSGKSTLAKLLVHYYDVESGRIRVGGQDICDMSLETLNQEISYVAQEQFLFNTSLLENIRVGRLDASDEEVLEAAKKAQCMEFIEKLPDGIESMAGDCGRQLSGGQRQRIALARAILKDAPIVVLDEAMAFADPDNEEKMEKAIQETVRGKTLLVIAHRLNSVQDADQICVMDHGRVEMTGTHEELLKNCGTYQKLWKASVESVEWKVENGNRKAVEV